MRSGATGEQHRLVVSSDTSRRVLETLLTSYPDEGVVVGVRVFRGWGDAIQVEVLTRRDPETGAIVDAPGRGQIRSAILEAFPDRRMSVRVLPVEA